MNTDRAGSQAWSQRRWISILDRMEYRLPGVGLRFWGPPLWLEVTMTGPDSDAWSSAGADGAPPESWNWNSDAPCPDVMELLEAGADDDQLLDSAARYTVENVILNATHEIGEWLRFDGRRLFPAHSVVSDVQGNGDVHVQVTFGPTATAAPAAPPDGGIAHQARLDRIAGAAGAWRFTYLPGTRIIYDSAGPLITDSTQPDGQADGPNAWRMSWSAATLAAAERPADDGLAHLVAIDVHRLLIRYEADRVCRSFRVDGRQPWRLPRDTEPPDAEPQARPLQVTVTHR